MPRNGMMMSMGLVRKNGSGGGRRKQAINKGGDPSGFDRLLRSSSTTWSDHVGYGAVPVAAANR